MAAQAAAGVADNVRRSSKAWLYWSGSRVQDAGSACGRWANQLRDKTGGVVVLAAPMAPDKVNILCMASKDAVAKGIHAGRIVKAVAQVMGGNGGGRPDMAQAGGKDASRLQDALQEAWSAVEGQIH